MPIRGGVSMRMLSVLLAASMAVTETVLLLEGRWQEAIPLHLCSLSALAGLAFCRTRRAWLLDFLWYLGMPGALLALAFPAPAVSRYQLALNLSYAATHALIAVIPVCALAGGWRIRRRQGGRMLAALHLCAAAAWAANCAMGTDFMFLAAPPAQTPLCIPYSWGYGWYLLALEGLACLMILLTGRILPAFLPKLFR